MFKFKLNITIIRILLIFIIITFFLPFFAVSCSRQDKGITFSGFELSAGKNINGEWQNGNALGFALIIPAFIALLLTFLIYISKNNKLYKICRYIFFIVPLFNIFAGFIIWYAFKSYILKMFIDRDFKDIPVFIDVKYGFWLYIVFNVAVFVFGVVNYFKRDNL